MITIFCDPNYKPSELYRQIDALLFFYDKVFLYAPSQGQIERAGLDWTRFKRLIGAGLIVPVGREFWFDSKERDALAARYAGNPEKSTTYRWSPLDEAILEAGPYEMTGNRSGHGYLSVSDKYRHYAESVQQNVAQSSEPAIAALVETAQNLRAIRRLPDELLHGEFANANPLQLAARMAFDTAGDLSIAEDLGVGSVYSTAEIGRVYQAVTRSLLPAAEHSVDQALTVTQPAAEYKLSEEELLIAARLARAIADSSEIGPLDPDLLIEYRDTACARLFRDFVAEKIRVLSRGTRRDEAARELESAFDFELGLIDKVAEWGPFTAGIGVASLWQMLQEEKLNKGSMTRRMSISVIAGLIFGMFGRLVPDVAPRAASDAIAHRFSTLFVLMREQKERQKTRLAPRN